MSADKGGNSGEMRHLATGQCHKRNVVLAIPLNLSAAGDALGIGEQNNLQQDLGIIRVATSYIVLIGGEKDGKI